MRPQAVDELVALGILVRVYVPFGRNWFRYWMRRLTESRGAWPLGSRVAYSVVGPCIEHGVNAAAPAILREAGEPAVPPAPTPGSL